MDIRECVKSCPLLAARDEVDALRMLAELAPGRAETYSRAHCSVMHMLETPEFRDDLLKAVEQAAAAKVQEGEHGPGGDP